MSRRLVTEGEFNEMKRSLRLLAADDCDECGGTGDVEPDGRGLRPCSCVLWTLVQQGADGVLQ